MCPDYAGKPLGLGQVGTTYLYVVLRYRNMIFSTKNLFVFFFQSFTAFITLFAGMAIGLALLR